MAFCNYHQLASFYPPRDHLRNLAEDNFVVGDCQVHRLINIRKLLTLIASYRYKPLVSSFGKILKRIREAKGLPQREAARRIDMDHARFSRLENDRTGFNPTRETVEKIAQALEASEEERGELLTAAGRLDQEIESMARLASSRPAIAKLFRIIIQLSQDQIEELLKRVERDFPAASEEAVSDVGIKRGNVARRKTRKRPKSKP